LANSPISTLRVVRAEEEELQRALVHLYGGGSLGAVRSEVEQEHQQEKLLVEAAVGAGVTAKIFPEFGTLDNSIEFFPQCEPKFP
jgi:hypothetical protein